MKTWKQIRRALSLSEDYEGEHLSFTLSEDHQLLEHAFPGCTVVIDHNPRMISWENYRFGAEAKREMRHVPEDGWGGVLVARRTNEHGAYVQTRSEDFVRTGARYFVETAVFVPSIPQWVVLR